MNIAFGALDYNQKLFPLSNFISGSGVNGMLPK